MTALKIIQGDLIAEAEAGRFDFIVHGCNCFHAMRSGIAGQLAKRYPQVAHADRQTERGVRNKLGTWSFADIERSDGGTFTVINAYTQFTYSRERDVFEYMAFGQFLATFSEFLKEQSQRENRRFHVGFPKIGCGLAGGDEKVIMNMLRLFAESLGSVGTVTVVEFKSS